MRPVDLSAASFTKYGPAARAFAEHHLGLLRALPLAVCPSFLKQVQLLDTSFPAERATLQWQCIALEGLPPPQFAQLVAPLSAIQIPPTLAAADWVSAPAEFLAKFTAHLWSSGQLDRFRVAAQALFAALPAREDPARRLVVVVLAADLMPPTSGPTLRRLRKQATSITHLLQGEEQNDLAGLMGERSRADATPYAHWYVDGDEALPALVSGGFTGTVLTYSGVAPVRERVLARMESTLQSAQGGPEQMRDQLARTAPQQVDSGAVTHDPVLQRFYTELFTESSGPQIFSTSFVQWSGRELARRVQPSTLVLRYTARQHNRDMNQLLANQEQKTDPAGSFVDAEMGAYYNWIEMNRITAPGRLTFVVLQERSPEALILSDRAAKGAQCATAMNLREALKNFG